MHVEVTRLVRSALEDAEIGVMRMLTRLDRDKIDGTEDPLPESVHIYTDVDRPDGENDPHWMRQIEPPQYPALVVVSDTVLNVDASELYQKFKPARVETIGTAIAYFIKDGDGRPEAVVEGNYILKAIRKTLHRLMLWPQDRRTLNDVRIVKMDRLTSERVAGATGDALMGFCLVSFTVLDLDPGMDGQ